MGRGREDEAHWPHACKEKLRKSELGVKALTSRLNSMLGKLGPDSMPIQTENVEKYLTELTSESISRFFKSGMGCR